MPELKISGATFRGEPRRRQAAEPTRIHPHTDVRSAPPTLDNRVIYLCARYQRKCTQHPERCCPLHVGDQATLASELLPFQYFLFWFLQYWRLEFCVQTSPGICLTTDKLCIAFLATFALIKGVQRPAKYRHHQISRQMDIKKLRRHVIR
jgi:hypothetical protein